MLEFSLYFFLFSFPFPCRFPGGRVLFVRTPQQAYFHPMNVMPGCARKKNPPAGEPALPPGKGRVAGRSPAPLPGDSPRIDKEPFFRLNSTAF